MRRLARLCLLAALVLAACDRFAPGATPTAQQRATATAPQPGSPTATRTLPPATPRPFTATRFASATAQASDTPTPTPYVPSATASATSDGCSARHTVQAGERLFRIGLQYGVDWQEIARANNISDPALIFPGQVLCIPASGAATPTIGPTLPATAAPSAAAPTPTTAATSSAGGPTILSFTASPANPSPGGQLTLSWASQGGASALLVEPICCASNGGNVTRDVPPNGSLTLALDAAVGRDTLTYALFVMGGTDTAQQSLQVRLPCPDTYFFNPPAGLLACPAGPPVSTPASEQLFEHGRMIWLGASNTILVLFGDGAPPNGPSEPPSGYASFPDTWTQGEPESDPALTPPAGLYQPVRGFGKVWRGELVPGQTVRDALGWALAPEQPYTGLNQRPWQTCLMAATDGDVTNCSGPGPILYLQNVEGRLIRVAEFGALARHSVAQWAFWTPG